MPRQDTLSPNNMCSAHDAKLPVKSTDCIVQSLLSRVTSQSKTKLITGAQGSPASTLMQGHLLSRTLLKKVYVLFIVLLCFFLSAQGRAILVETF